MGNFQFSGAFTAVQDSDFQPADIPERGAFIGGKPIRQGWQAGTLKFAPMSSGAFNELRARYEQQKDLYTQGQIPKISGFGYRSVSAWWHAPVPTGWDGGDAHGVTMQLTRIVDN